MGWPNVFKLWSWLRAESGPTCRSPVFEPCAEWAGECEDGVRRDPPVGPYQWELHPLGGYCWCVFSCFDDCEPCA